MAKKKPKLTPNQLEYQKQLKLLKRRIKRWERKGFLYDYSLPETPKKVTKKDIQKLKNITFKKFTSEEKQELREKYRQREELIDESVPSSINKPLSKREEIDVWLDDLIDEILNPSLIERERDGAKGLLYSLIDWARVRLGDDVFYDYLQDKSIVEKLKKAASEYIQSYVDHKGVDHGAESLRLFTETLNLGRPLTIQQAEDIEIYGRFDIDIGGTDYDL